MAEKLIIIGAGASGIFCAVNVARMCPTLQVIVLEKSNHLLSKVRISGGGRCNVTHAHDSIAEAVKCYPRGEQFVKKTFQSFFMKDTIEWFAQRGVPTKTEADGRMFPQSNNSQTIIDCLLAEAQKYQVQIILRNGVEKIIAPTAIEKQFVLHINQGQTMQADYVMVATGGFPKAEQFNFVTKLGHTISDPIPSLFTFNASKTNQTHLPKLTDLMGVVVQDTHVKIKGTKLESKGPTLITHWGISGPAVLTLSAFGAQYLHDAEYLYEVQMNWCAFFNETAALEKIRETRNIQGVQQVALRNPFGLPNRLWEFLMGTAGITPKQKWSELNAKQQNTLAKQVCSYNFLANGKTTFKEEFVTAGGINLAEITAHTCESKLIPQLFFGGEVMNVDGKTGGYNFQHAWSSGWVVAKAIAQMHASKNSFA
jgi:predicted Rossmann fold flavoprotein